MLKEVALMKIYHCDDPKDNPIPLWMLESKPCVSQTQEKPAEPLFLDLSSFFPAFYRPWKKKS